MSDKFSRGGSLQGLRPNPYYARSKAGRIPHLEDPAFRTRLIATASTGMSRKGVAAVCGCGKSSLEEWIQRGKAFPLIEPYGSFARDYEQAERGLELAAAGTIALIVGQLYKLASSGQWDQIDALPTIRELARMLGARYPNEWGTSAHRTPEPELLGEQWIEKHGLTQEQLGAMVCDPPEPLKEALVSNADAVYSLLRSSGWRPAALTAE